jgi:hypothetical protein
VAQLVYDLNCAMNFDFEDGIECLNLKISLDSGLKMTVREGGDELDESK